MLVLVQRIIIDFVGDRDMTQSPPQFLRSQLVTGFAIGVLLPLLIFLFLASHVWRQGKGFIWDIPFLQWVHTTARPILDAIAQTVTPLGVIWGVFPVMVILGGVLLDRRNWRSLLYLIVTPVGSALLNRILKLYFHRERPHLWDTLSSDLTDAFPSGHAMSSTTLVVVLIVLAWNTRWRWFTVIGGSLFVLAIGWTRLYLGVHYPSDILAGWLLAIAWSISLMLIIQPQNTERQVANQLSEPTATNS